jgi:hypothetical protein
LSFLKRIPPKLSKEATERFKEGKLMYEWLIKYENDDTLQEIKKIGLVEYEPKFKEMKFIIMKSYLSKETILNIKGVTDCLIPALGTFS